MHPFLDKLNDAQREAVLCTEGPLLVAAGAGVGKTRIVVNRAANIVSKGVSPSKIFLVTFTNKAADEMYHRVKRMTEGNVVASTFHSLAYRTMLKAGEYRTVIDEKDSKKLFFESKEAKELKKDHPDIYDTYSYMREVEDRGLADDSQLAIAHSLYTARLQSSGLVDFYGLLTWMERYLDNEGPPCEYLTVDEFQDVNEIQYRISRKLVANKNIAVVGDAMQCIYMWRGSNPRHISQFPKIYEKCKVVKLEKNYRSIQPILDTANTLISSTNDELHLKLWSDKKVGKRPELRTYFTSDLEAKDLRNSVSTLIRHGVDPREIAILIRAGWLSSSIEDEFKKWSVPYKVVGTISYFDRAEVRDAMAFLRYATNPNDYLSFNRIVMAYKGIGEVTAADMFLNPPLDLNSGHMVYRLPSIADEYKDKKGQELSTLFETLGIWEFIQMKYPQDELEERLNNVNYIRRVLCSSNTSLKNAIGYLVLDEQKHQDPTVGQVTISTCHAAKGLEWSHVFVVGCEDGILPHYRGNIDEERRLFYVATTRAKERLYYSTCEYRDSFGRKQSYIPSRFLAEAGMM